MKKFKQMSKSDRIKMEALLNAGLSKAAVAEQLHFHRSTIYREYDSNFFWKILLTNPVRLCIIA